MKPAAVEEASNQFYDQLLGFVKKRTQNSQDAEEIVQDVFVKLLGQSLDIETKSLRSWMFSTTKNSMIDLFRKRKREVQNHTPLGYHEELEQLTDEDDLELSSCLVSMLPQLEEADAALIREIDIKGVSQKAYAEEHGMNYSKLKSRVQRARRKLKSKLFNCCQFALDSRGIPYERIEKDECGCDGD